MGKITGRREREKKIKRECTKSKVLFPLLWSLIVIAIIFLFCTSLPIFAIPSEDNNNNISQLEQYLTSSPYSDFQKRMILNTVQEALKEGISAEDTLSIIKSSVQNEVDPYNIKKFLDTVITAKNEGISEKPLLNKIKEGLAKKVEGRLIINVLNQKSENMKIAQELLAEIQIENGQPEEMIDILADSLTNGIPPSVLAQILQISSEQGKEWSEVEEVTKELANLGLKATELGIDSDKIEAIFNQALSSESSLENICINIQELIISAIAVQVSTSSIQRNVSVQGTDSSSIPGLPSSSGSPISGSGSTIPSGETGTSPISSDGDNKTDSESGSSPLN